MDHNALDTLARVLYRLDSLSDNTGVNLVGTLVAEIDGTSVTIHCSNGDYEVNVT